MSMTLYEIHAEIEEVLEQVDPETGEITEELSKQLDELNIKLEDKLVNCAAYVKALRYEEKALKEEASLLQQRAKTKANRIRSLMEYIADHFSAGKIDAPMARLRWQKNPPSVVVDAPTLIPSEFWIQPEPQISKSNLKEALKSGPVDGAHLEQRRSLRIE